MEVNRKEIMFRLKLPISPVQNFAGSVHDYITWTMPETGRLNNRCAAMNCESHLLYLHSHKPTVPRITAIIIQHFIR